MSCFFHLTVNLLALGSDAVLLVAKRHLDTRETQEYDGELPAPGNGALFTDVSGRLPESLEWSQCESCEVKWERMNGLNCIPHPWPATVSGEAPVLPVPAGSS